MFKHSIDSSQKFMGHSKHSFLIGEPFSSSTLKVFSEVFIMDNHTNSHKPDYSPQMSITSFRNPVTSFKLSRLINSGVKTSICNKFFWGAKSTHISNFSNKVHCSGISYTLDRFKRLNVLTEGSFLPGLFKKFYYFFKLLFKEEGFSNFTLKDKFSHREELTDRVLSPLFKFLSSKRERFTRGRGNNLLYFRDRSRFQCLGRGIFFKDSENTHYINVNFSFKFREKDSQSFFNLVFKSCNLGCNSFSLTGKLTEFMRKERFFRENMLGDIQGKGTYTGIGTVGFGVLVLRIKNHTDKVFLTEIDKEIDVVAARRFFTNNYGVFREGAKFTDKSFKAMRIHREIFFKDNVLRRRTSTSRETLLGDINANEDFKVIYKGTSFLILNSKAEKEHCHPILYDDKGFHAQLTYHGLGRGATNSLEDYTVQVNWTCSHLPVIYLGKTYTYKLYPIYS